MNKKIGIGIFGFLFLAVSLWVGVYLNQSANNTKIKTSAAGADLTLTSNVSSPKVGDTIVVAVSMNTNGLSVSGLDLKLSYDATKLTATSVQAGPFLPHIFIDGSIASGTASIVVGCPLDNNGAYPVSGAGLVAQVTFIVNSTGTSTISIGTGTKISASGQNTNQLGTTNNLQVVTTTSTASPNPTRSPSPRPTATRSPSPGPTRSPSPIPTRSPSPAPGATRSPSPVPTRSPSPAPTGSGTTYTAAVIATHNTTSNCWIIINNNVYNVTTYLTQHPGGVSAISPYCGKDATQAFNNQGHSNNAKSILATFIIGTLAGAPTHSPSPTSSGSIPGDVNGDGMVNIVDIGIIIDNYSLSPLPDPRADLNGDGIANIVDIGIVIDNYAF